MVEDFSPGDYDPPSSMQVIKAPVVCKALSRINPFRSIRFPCKREQKEETLVIHMDSSLPKYPLGLKYSAPY